MTASPAPSSLSMTNSIAYSSRSDDRFSFLRYFTDPSAGMDRLAIGKTAEYSVRRNLEGLYSHLESELIPANPPPSFLGDIPFPSEFLPVGVSSDDSFSPKLLKQLNAVLRELVEISNSMGSSIGEQQDPLDMLELTSLFTATNLFAFISVFFHSLHWHLPIVHFPTFDPGNISSFLLLSICLTGATYTSPMGGTTLPPRLLDVAEELIFRQITNLSTLPPVSLKNPTRLLPTVQLIQSALIMEMLQFGQDKADTRRRIRIIRHPCLVSVLRSLGFFQLRRSMAPSVCDDATWRDMVAEEACIRYGSNPYHRNVTSLSNNHEELLRGSSSQMGS